MTTPIHIAKTIRDPSLGVCLANVTFTYTPDGRVSMATFLTITDRTPAHRLPEAVMVVSEADATKAFMACLLDGFTAVDSR